MINPWALLGIMVAAGAMTGAAYWQGRADGAAGELATQKREADVAKAAREAADAAIAKGIAGIKVHNTTIREEVQREVIREPVYRDCMHSPEQLQRLNAALTGRGTEPAGVGQLPAADAAAGPLIRRDDGQAGGGGGAVPGVP